MINGNGRINAVIIGTVLTVIVTVVTGVFAFDNRVQASIETILNQRMTTVSSRLMSIEHKQNNLADSMDKTIDLLRGQYLMRFAVLNLRNARGGLTPEQKVELRGLSDTLRRLTENDSRGF